MPFPLTLITHVGVFGKIVLFIGAAVRQDYGPKQAWPDILFLPQRSQCVLSAFHVLGKVQGTQ